MPVSGAEKPPQLLLPLGHIQPLTSVVWSPDGKRILTGAADNTPRLWDAESSKSLLTFTGHTGNVTSVKFSTDGKQVLTGSEDKTARLWDARTGKLLLTLVGHKGTVQSVAFHPKIKRVFTGSSDDTVQSWDLDSGKPGVCFSGHKGSILSLAISPDGNRIATSSEDRTIQIWDTNSGKSLRTISYMERGVNSMVFNPDGTHLLTAINDHTARVWDVGTGKELLRLSGHTDWVVASDYSPDGKRILTGSYDKTGRIWDAKTGKLLHTLYGHTGRVSSVSFSPDGTRVLTGSEDITARIWNANNGTLSSVIEGQADCVSSVAISPDGKRILTGCWDKTARIWSIESGKLLHSLTGHKGFVTSATFSRDGSRVLTSSEDKTIRVWDVVTGKCLFTSPEHDQLLVSAAFHPDGIQIVTDFCVWNTSTGKKLLQLPITRAISVVYSPDGKRILANTGDNHVLIIDSKSGKKLLKCEGHTNTVTRVAYSPDGKRLLTGSDDGTARIWDANSGKTLQVLFGHDDKVTTVAFSSDAKRVATGCKNGSAKLWDAITGKQLAACVGHGDPINSIIFSPDNKMVFTGSSDGTVAVWNAGTGQRLYSFLGGSGHELRWTPEGYYADSLEAETLVAWKSDDPKAPGGYRIVGPDQFRKTFYRPDLFPYLLTELDLDKALAKANEARRIVSPATTIARAIPPVVILSDPDRDGAVEGEKLTVKSVAVSVGDHPVTKMRLLVDGRPYRGVAGTFNVPTPRLGEVRRGWTIDLDPGEHTLQVIAESAVSEGRSAIRRITRKVKVDTLPTLHVLAIGISEYEEKALRKGVYYSAGDARKFADTVETSSKSLYRAVKVTRLIDRDATRRKILKALSEMSKQATTRDVVLIHYAGHGRRDEQRTFYFLPVDADPQELSVTCISEGVFKEQIKKLPGKVVLLLDACHSGSLVENQRSIDGLTDELYRDLTSTEYGIVMMCSSRGTQVSKESTDLKSGYFTHALVEGLKGKASMRNKAVYFTGLNEYVTTRVKQLTKGTQHPLASAAIIDVPLSKP